MAMYTIVQHSGFGYRGDPTFQRGLEVRSVNSKQERQLIERVGGLLFDNYEDASTFEEQASYPEGYEGLIPLAQGTFSDKKVDGLAIYLPMRKVMG